MQIGCCVGMQYYDDVKKAGFDTIALPAKEVAAWSETEFETMCKRIKTGQLAVRSLNAFCTNALKLSGKSYNAQAVYAYAQPLIMRAWKLGVQFIGIGAPASRNIQEGDSAARCMQQFHEAITILCEIAAPYKIEILLESVCSAECNFITRTAEANRLVRLWNIKNLHLVYDVYHEMWEGQSPKQIPDFADEIKVVHLAREENGARFYPNQEGLHFCMPYIHALQLAGYQGEICIEAFEGDVKQGIARSAESMNFLRNG
ncbi:MAG: TIM barrel protein [Ruthenibacterium sp.]